MGHLQPPGFRFRERGGRARNDRPADGLGASEQDFVETIPGRRKCFSIRNAGMITWYSEPPDYRRSGAICRLFRIDEYRELPENLIDLRSQRQRNRHFLKCTFTSSDVILSAWAKVPLLYFPMKNVVLLKDFRQSSKYPFPVPAPASPGHKSPGGPSHTFIIFAADRSRSEFA